MADGRQRLGVRGFGGPIPVSDRLHGREQVLDEQCAAQRFFAAGYQPRETDVIVDVGAHVGPFTVLAAPLGSSLAARSTCWSPALENFEILAANITSNGINQRVRPSIGAQRHDRYRPAVPTTRRSAGGTRWAASRASYEEVLTQRLRSPRRAEDRVHRLSQDEHRGRRIRDLPAGADRHPAPNRLHGRGVASDRRQRRPRFYWICSRGRTSPRTSCEATTRP